MPLSGGILIIGSLLWDERREAWRNLRLDMNSAEPVTAPIRYGRRSQTRGNTYTMVFSSGCEAGRAKLVRYSHTVVSIGDLISEAEHLWAAEQNATPNAELSAGWGCVTLLHNPERPLSETFLTGWADRISRNRNYGNMTQPATERRLVSPGGLLEIAWPRRVADGSAVPLDFLLATATCPTLTNMPPSYPSAEEIAAAWNADTQGHVEYFWKNRDHGICTFQDDEISARLMPRVRQ